MGYKLQEIYNKLYNIDMDIIKIANDAEKCIQETLTNVNIIKELNQLKVIKAMQNNNLSDSHFNGTTGYGYDDRGREVLDSVYAEIFKAEDALVRHQIVSGTHALALCMFANLRPGDELLSITGKPYDTLEEVIGIRGQGNGSLKEYNISYRQLELKDNKIDLIRLKEVINDKTKLLFIQRSRGYCFRPSIMIEEIEQAIKVIRKIKNDIIILVDNCYGEFVEEREPIEVGADLIAGSLIKNPGGGLALTGGYIAGKENFIKNTANRLTAPGLGKKVGSSLGNNRLMFQGLFMAPHVVSESIKGAIFCSAIMEKLGFETSPAFNEKRGDIIQAIKFGNVNNLISFCQGIQKGSPVDSYVTPQPWDMPGYEFPVIMAAGAFIQGASIELSADAPIKPPYIAFMQGGLVYEHVKLGVLIAIQKMKESKLLEL